MAFNFAKSFQLPKDFNVDFQKISTNIQSTVQGSIKEISKDVKDFSNNFQPLTQNALHLVKETIGTNDLGEPASQLPEEYLLLEKKVDSLKSVYKRILQVTQTYEVESYDYPPNISESFSDISKTFSEKFHELSSAATTKDAEKVLNNNNNNNVSEEQKYSTKSLAHAIAKAAYNSRKELLKQVKKEEEDRDEDEEEEDSLAKVLLKLAHTQNEIGDLKLQQDGLIIKKFNGKIKESLDFIFKETIRQRRQVEQSRHELNNIRYEINVAEESLAKLRKIKEVREKEAAKAKEETVKEEVKEEIKEEKPAIDEIANHEKYLNDLQAKLEACEDDLVEKTTVAVTSMKKFLDPVESIGLIKILTTIQLNFYKASVKQLEGLLEDIDTISKEIEEDDDDEDDDEEEEEE